MDRLDKGGTGTWGLIKRNYVVELDRAGIKGAKSTQLSPQIYISGETSFRKL